MDGSRHTGRDHDRRVIAQQWDGDDALDGLRGIGIDEEISYRRHHKYLTVVVDHGSGRVVWAGKDRGPRPCCASSRSSDPNGPPNSKPSAPPFGRLTYLIVLRKKAPQARVIFDRFHIVRHLNQAVTRVRQQLVREADPMTRADLKTRAIFPSHSLVGMQCYALRRSRLVLLPRAAIVCQGKGECRAFQVKVGRR